MRDFVAVCRREIEERRLALLLAALLGLMPLLLPFLPALRHHSPAEVRSGAALLLGAILAVGGALTLGGSIWASDFTGGRLGFYLARPIRSWAIWGGKLAALVILLTAITGLALGPGLLAGEGLPHGMTFDLFPDWRAPTSPSRWSWSVLALLALALTSHLARMLAVRRSALLLLDLTFLLTASGVVAFAFRSLLAAPAPGDLMRGERWLVAGIALVALTAIVVETTLGRLDTARGRRWLSLVLCVGLGAMALGTGLFARWTLGAGIDDLRTVGVGAVSRDGRWLFLGGPARHRVDYTPGFLYDVETHASRPLGGLLGARMYRGDEQLVFSDDSRRALWVHMSAFGSRTERVLDLGSPGAPLGFTAVSSYGVRTLSPSGRFVVTIAGGRVGLVDLRQPGQPVIASEALADDRVEWARFVGEDRVRMLTRSRGDGGQAKISDLAVGRGGLEPVCRMPRLTDTWTSHPSPARDRLVAVLAADEGPLGDLPRPGRLALFSSADCSLLADLGPWRYDLVWEPVFLGDGRLIVFEKGEAERTLRLYDRDGHLLRDIELPAMRGWSLGGLLAANLLVVSSAGDAGPSRTEILDLTTGDRRPLGSGLWPVASCDVAPGSPATRVFSTPTGLVLVDPATRLRTPLVPTPPIRRQ